jgi:hypothetical protein
MSERGYFSQRLLIPGAMFLFFFFAFNIVPICGVLGLGQNAAIFGAILAALGSPTIGFFVSQVWFWWFHRRPELFNVRHKEIPQAPFEVLREKYPEIRKENDAGTSRKTWAIYDYVLHRELHSDERSRGISGYAFRRNDMYVILSCSEFALALGVVTGVFCRIMSQYFIFTSAFWTSFYYLQPGSRGEFLVSSCIAIAAIILFVLLRRGRDLVKFEYQAAHAAIIKGSDIKIEALKKIFPSNYFEVPEK